ncbi:hypothetical protein BKK52_04180 [Rodentibacter trehalosifermentans]|nr:hypothetical protein [Rodentibacter trehalosifermentans]OOF49242.1 hypothetical protein BKK52_04180 [Rodentibacter trehalosifermentans]
MSPLDVKLRFESEYLINNPVPKRDYGHFPFAGTDAQRSQAVDSLPEESKNWLGWRSEKHSHDEEMYYAINNKYEAIENYKESFNGKLAYSVKDGLELGAMIYSGGVLSNALNKLPVAVNSLNLPTKVVSAAGKVGDFAKGHPILTEKLTNSGLSMAATYLGNTYESRDTSASDLIWNGTTGFITGAESFKTTLAVNIISGGVQGYFEDNTDSVKHAGYKAVSSEIATLFGGAIGKSVEKTADAAITKGLSKYKSNYSPEYRNIKMDPADHKLTASYGRSKEAQIYRDKQKELLEQGKIDEAINMDIMDIRQKFGSKYDSAIEEMLEYSKKLNPDDFKTRGK